MWCVHTLRIDHQYTNITLCSPSPGLLLCVHHWGYTRLQWPTVRGESSIWTQRTLHGTSGEPSAVDPMLFISAIPIFSTAPNLYGLAYHDGSAASSFFIFALTKGIYHSPSSHEPHLKILSVLQFTFTTQNVLVFCRHQVSRGDGAPCG